MVGITLERNFLFRYSSFPIIICFAWYCGSLLNKFMIPVLYLNSNHHYRSNSGLLLVLDIEVEGSLGVYNAKSQRENHICNQTNEHHCISYISNIFCRWCTMSYYQTKHIRESTFNHNTSSHAISTNKQFIEKLQYGLNTTLLIWTLAIQFFQQCAQ